jgi:hypothetical protein
MSEILPPPPIGEPFASYQWDDWYRKVRTVINEGQTVAWASITGKPSLVETSRTISTTAPLSGGGDLTANRTLSVAAFSSSSSGVVPASSGDADEYLAGNGTWKDPLATAISVTGSRGSGTALVNLLTALATIGLITDDTDP